MNITFKKLITPTPEIAETLNTWVNDPLLVAFIRPCKNKEELEEYMPVTVEFLKKHLEYKQTIISDLSRLTINRENGLSDGR